MLKRRFSLVLASAAGVVLLALATVYSRTVEALWPVSWFPNPQLASPVVDPFLIDLQERTFRFFWDTANPKNGLVPDRYPTPSFVERRRGRLRADRVPDRRRARLRHAQGRRASAC